VLVDTLAPLDSVTVGPGKCDALTAGERGQSSLKARLGDARAAVFMLIY